MTMAEFFFQSYFRANAPLEIEALIFLLSFHSKKFDMGRSTVSLSLRKV